MANISIGRFDKLTNFQFNTESRKLRLWSKKPTSLPLKNFTPISFDGDKVFFEENIYTINNFDSLIKNKVLKNLMVLTNKEKLLLIEKGAAFAFDVAVLEINFPIFHKLKFSPDLAQNYNQLKNCLKKVHQLNICGNTLGQHAVTEGMYKAERKLRFKNALDINFSFASLSGYQEVFKLKEERPDRMIIALDYNSMYASCMGGDFLDPKSLEYKKIDKKISTEAISAGFYRVILSRPKTAYILNYHPFKYVCLKHSYSFRLSPQDDVELLLFSNEIEYYREHFEEIKIIDGITSRKTIKHPLNNYSLKLYSKRLRASKNNNKVLASLYKLKLAMLHSATNTTKFSIQEFDNYHTLKEFIEKKFFISSLNDKSPRDFLDIINESNCFSTTFIGNKIKLKFRNNRTPDNIFCLSAETLANARLKMTKTLEFLNKFDGLEICYVNIDSVHVSIPRKQEGIFFEYCHNIISDKIGDLKIQAIADKGYWLDIGRYWLVKNNTIEKFANAGFNSLGNINPFVNKTKKFIRFKSRTFDFCKLYYSSLEESFSSKKILLDENINGTQNYERFAFEQIETIINMLKSEQNEAVNSLKTKGEIFSFIKKTY